MRRRMTFWLAWSLGGLSVAMFVAGVTLALLAWNVAVPAARVPSGGFGDLLIFAPFLAFPIVGALIASKRPENPIGWICLTVGLFWMLIVAGEGSTAYSLATTGSVTGPVMLDALTQSIWVPPVGLLGTFMVMLFPDGRLPSRRWRPLAWFSGAVILLASVALDIGPGPLPNRGGISNPLGIEGYPWLQYAGVALVLLLPVCILASAFSLISRYRHSDKEVRQQIKWLAFAASFIGANYLVLLVSEIFFASDALLSDGTTPLWASLEQHLLLVSFACIPTAIGFAVLKHRLYDIDIIINRALVYGSLTATLALVYVGSVVALQYVFRTFTGSESQLAIVVSTLSIAALFGPLRRRIQDVIDRRFYRRKYDAARTLEAFGKTLRDETELEILSNDLVSVVRETLQPEYASLWLRPPDEAKPRMKAEQGP
ncbi:MAG TPA: hypothetical protein VFJ72_11155 [Rubrobacteraceae bacterium]|nr:hypothetical protein [Rubrobacteraceae bacterium]